MTLRAITVEANGTVALGRDVTVTQLSTLYLAAPLRKNGAYIVTRRF